MTANPITTTTTRSPVKRGDPAAEAATPAMRAAAEEFESVFLGQIMRGLTAGLTGRGLAGGGGDDDPFASMLQDEYAKLISRSGGIGLGDAVLREMLKIQEAAR
jgi:Rod binding domain-containing protein